MTDTIHVLPHNPNWILDFQQESKILRKLGGSNFSAIHHIGSTAVKGLNANPVIDIMLIVKNIFHLDSINQKFIELGYECFGEKGVRGRRYYQKNDNNRKIILQVFQLGDKKQIDRHIAIRDYLKKHKDAVLSYNNLKAKLNIEYYNDFDSYTKGKEEFLNHLEEKALLWQKQEAHRSYYLSIGICLGVCFGTTLGNLYNNLALGLALGFSFGLSIGTILGNSTKNFK